MRLVSAPICLSFHSHSGLRGPAEFHRGKQECSHSHPSFRSRHPFKSLLHGPVTLKVHRCLPRDSFHPPAGMKVNVPRAWGDGELSKATLVDSEVPVLGSAAERRSPCSKPFEVHHLLAKSVYWSDSRRKTQRCFPNKEQNKNHAVTLESK